MHVIRPAHHPQQGQGLVRRDHDLEAWSGRADKPPAGERVAEPARAKRQTVGLGGDFAGQAEARGTGAAPAQRGLAARPVVIQRLTRVVVSPAQDGLFVVVHRFGAHHLEPRHGAALPPQPARLK
jgi:hypothetical protein